MSPECVCEGLAQNTQQIIMSAVFEYVEYALMQMSCCSRRRGQSFKSSAPALAVLTFANKHSTISTSQLSLQKIYSVSKSDCTVHNTFAFMNYTDRDHRMIQITT